MILPRSQHLPRRARARLAWLPLAVLAIAAAGFLALGLGEAWSDAPTFDEPVYIAAGLAAVLHHDLTLNDEHPPAPKVLAALPVLLAHPVIPGNRPWAGNDERSYSGRFIDAQLSAGILRKVVFTARLAPLAETTAVAFAVFALGSELLGPAAGAFGGLLWLASPLVLGIGHLDGTDVPLALTTVTASWTLARWLRLRNRPALVWLGLALAGAALSEISGLLVVAAGLAAVGAATVHEAASVRSGARQALARAGLAALVALAAVWITYAVLDPAVLGHPGLLPGPYLDGIRYLWSSDTAAAPGYLAGISWTGPRDQAPGRGRAALRRGRRRMAASGPARAAASAAGRRAACGAARVVHPGDAQGYRRALPAPGARAVGRHLRRPGSGCRGAAARHPAGRPRRDVRAAAGGGGRHGCLVP
ncbi:MAG: glycosyltransferase family 39 protein [Streptosporangiaceae bacterium]